jgi:hypothetical protein
MGVRPTRLCPRDRQQAIYSSVDGQQWTRVSREGLDKGASAQEGEVGPGVVPLSELARLLQRGPSARIGRVGAPGG